MDRCFANKLRFSSSKKAEKSDGVAPFLSSKDGETTPSGLCRGLFWLLVSEETRFVLRLVACLHREDARRSYFFLRGEAFFTTLFAGAFVSGAFCTSGMEGLKLISSTVKISVEKGLICPV